MAISKSNNHFGDLAATNINPKQSNKRTSTSRVLTDDEINYIRENTGKIPIQEICKQIHIFSEDLKMLTKEAGIEMKKRPNKGAPKYEVVPFAGKSSFIPSTDRKKPPESVKKRVSQKSFEKSMEESFANPILQVSIETGQVLLERDCPGGAWV